MAYGLRITNDANELLVDSNYVNPTFVQKLEFNTTPAAGEELDGPILHPGYIQRYYITPTVSIGTGTYIVLWTLPDSSANVWYLFPTSVAENNLQFECSVFATTSTSSTSYTLPTAYIFTVDADGINAMSSTGPALRMYNGATPQKKTFDSNFTQLVPYSLSDLFNLPSDPLNDASLSLATPTNPIYLLPKCSILYVADAYQSIFSGQTQKTDYTGTNIVYRRTGNTVYAKNMTTYYSREDYAATNVMFTAGTLTNLSVIVADADLYQTPSGGTGGGTNPTYNLSRSTATVNEGSSFTITLTTTNVANGTTIGYNVTGIQQADLSSGTTTGNFTVNNNTATVGFTLANDNLTEGTETFRLELLTGTTPYIDITVAVNDTSTAVISYSISPQTASVNEGSSITFTVTTTNVANGTTLYWAINGGSANAVTDFSAYNGSFTISSNSGTFTVYPTADSFTEGSETFGVGVRTVSVSGTEVATSGTITINDSSTTPYNEAITGPSTVGIGTSFTLNISGGAPNTNWSYNSGFSSSSGTLDGSGATSITVPGSAQPYPGTYTYDFYFLGTGNSRSKSVTAVQLYNESLSISPSTVSVSNYTTISISGGQPNATVNYATTNYGDPQPSSFPGSVTLNSSGNYSNYLTGGAITGGVTGDKMLWVYFPYGGNNVRSARVTVVPNAGQPVGGQYCSGTTLYQNYTDGSGGTYASVVEYNSSSCGYSPPPAGQPVGAQYCSGTTLYQNYTDGSGGTYAGVVQYNSTTCGYTAPPTATWTAVFSNSGSPGDIYCGVEVYLTAPTPTTVTFTFTGSVLQNGDSFYVPSVTITAGNTASAGYEYSGFTNGSPPYGPLTLVISTSSAPYTVTNGSTKSYNFLYSSNFGGGGGIEP
jgi:hypothetical protein